MSWLSFAIVTWVFFGLELGLRDTLQLGPHAIAPSFVVALLIYIALNASPRAVLWAAIILGLFVDLTGSIELMPRYTTVIVGPHAIAYFLAAHMVLAMRGMIVSRNPLSMGVLAVVAAAVAQIVVVAFLTIHKLYGDPIVWNASERLVSGLASSVYTGVVAAILSLVLIPLTPLFGFTTARRFGH
jgi:rod shape-determining protein MreD